MKRHISIIILTIIITLFAFNVSATEKAYVNCNLLNVRVSPNTNCEVIRQLSRGTSFDIIYTDNGWYNVRLGDGITGFVNALYVTKGEVANISTSSSEVGNEIAASAHNYIGYRYVYGTAGPGTFDCSGFTSYLYKQHGYYLPRSSYDQGSYGTYVNKTDLVAGDLVFFSNRSDRRINHVGLYVGEGNFIHASTSGRGVVMDNLNENYYVNHYVTARRVL